jgi:O-antigen/teichoic acid export membrane protein
MIVLIVSFLNEPNGLLMIAAGQQQTLAILLGASVAVNIIANLILAPALGGMGSALARVISVMVFSAPNAILVSRRIRPHHPLQKLPRILPAAGLAAVALVVFKSFLPWWLAAFMSMCVYAPALIVSRGAPSNDLNTLRQYGASQVQQKSKSFKNTVRRFL